MSREPVKRERSRSEFKRAVRVIPGGVNSPARAFGAVGGEPLFIERGEGAYLVDVDGNRLDRLRRLVGPADPGACPSRGGRRRRSGARQGDELRRADRSGSRAGRADHRGGALDRAGADGQLRHRGDDERDPRWRAVSRAATGSIKFAGCYHGHVDSLLVKAGSGAATHGVPVVAGRPAGLHGRHAGAANSTMPPALEETLSRRGRQDCLRDPRTGRRQHGGRAAGAADSWKRLQRLCQQHGAPADFRRSDDRFSPRLRRRSGEVRRQDSARPDDAGQDRGGRHAGRRLRRPGRRDEKDFARRPRVPGGHAFGQSARHGLLGSPRSSCSSG